MAKDPDPAAAAGRMGDLFTEVGALPRRRSRSARRTLGAVAAWIPTLAALVLLAQTGVLGLRPALGESRLLDRVEDHLAGRVERALSRRADLQRLRTAQLDPLYIERERRQLEARSLALRAGAGD